MGQRNNIRGGGQGRRWGTSNGQGRMSGPLAAGPGGYCVCQNCGTRVEHVTGKPCNQQKCPKCGTQMMRE